MRGEQMAAHRTPSAGIAHAVVAAALAAVAAVQLLGIPGDLGEATLVSNGYYALIGAASFGGLLLPTAPEQRLWMLVDLIAFGAIVAYVLSHSTSRPTDSFVVNSWSGTSVFAAIATEAVLTLLAQWQLQQLPHPRMNADRR